MPAELISLLDFYLHAGGEAHILRFFGITSDVVAKAVESLRQLNTNKWPSPSKRGGAGGLGSTGITRSQLLKQLHPHVARSPMLRALFRVPVGSFFDTISARSYQRPGLEVGTKQEREGRWTAVELEAALR